jgi:hypothetical protein
MALRVVRAAVVGYSAEFGALYLEEHGVERLVHSQGTTHGNAALEVPIELENRRLGRLVLGKRGASSYSRRDCGTLRRSADAIARALVFADEEMQLRTQERHESQTHATRSRSAVRFQDGMSISPESP